MKKKLLIITGAGASIEFGMPSVTDIDALLEAWGIEILPLKDDNTKSLYSWERSICRTTLFRIQRIVWKDY
jgi:hypothetical protein